MEKVNIRKKLDSINEHWSQEIVAKANGQLFKVAKGIEHRPKADHEVEFLVVGLNITSNAAGGKPN